MVLFKFKTIVDWNVRCETPAGKARLGETPQAKAEEAPRPPAESECLKWKSTLQLVSGNPLLSVDSLPGLLAESVCGVLASQLSAGVPLISSIH
ncbi:hypothetical protein CMV16_19160 [Peribacillus simplex]|nr:hypothetical protein CMV16_19160 [Peribacillus simplex]